MFSIFWIIMSWLLGCTWNSGFALRAPLLSTLWAELLRGRPKVLGSRPCKIKKMSAARPEPFKLNSQQRDHLQVVHLSSLVLDRYRSQEVS